MIPPRLMAMAEGIYGKIMAPAEKPDQPDLILAELKRTNELLLIICDALGGKV
jgi:hypothetical protein